MLHFIHFLLCIFINLIQIPQIPNLYISPKIGFDPTQIPGFNGESGSGISDISAGLSS